MATLSVQQLCKSYPTPSEELVILKEVNLEMSAGENLAIVGPSGSGKSTLLQILGTLDTPTSGKVLIDGNDPFQLNEKQLAKFRNAHIGFIFQDHHLLPHLSVIENMLIPTLASGSPNPEQLQRADQLLERVGLGSRRHHLPSELSGGERERVSVARALLLKPTLVLADEPTGNLDQANAERVAQLLIELPQQEQAILVVVTHSQTLAQSMQRCLRLDTGHLKP